MKYEVKLRYLAWVIAGLSLLWNLVEFTHDLVEASNSTTGYPTYFSALSSFVSGIFGSFTYFVYGEILNYLGKLVNQKNEQ